MTSSDLVAPLMTMGTSPKDIQTLMAMKRRPIRRWAVRCSDRNVGLSCIGAITLHRPAGRMCMNRPAGGRKSKTRAITRVGHGTAQSGSLGRTGVHTMDEPVQYDTRFPKRHPPDKGLQQEASKHMRALRALVPCSLLTAGH